MPCALDYQNIIILCIMLLTIYIITDVNHYINKIVNYGGNCLISRENFHTRKQRICYVPIDRQAFDRDFT